jgi:hypothetical protein
MALAQRKRRARHNPREIEASLCQAPISDGASSATRNAPGVRGVVGFSVLFGFESGLSEEPTVQDVEPVTLDEEPFLSALSNPPSFS